MKTALAALFTLWAIFGVTQTFLYVFFGLVVVDTQGSAGREFLLSIITMLGVIFAALIAANIVEKK